MACFKDTEKSVILSNKQTRPELINIGGFKCENGVYWSFRDLICAVPNK